MTAIEQANWKPRIQRMFRGHWIACDGRVMAAGVTPFGAIWNLIRTYFI